MAGETFIPSYLGHVILQKTAGASSNPSVGAEWFLPVSRVVPYNLEGNSYPGIIDGDSYPSVKYQGKKRPGFTLFFYAKPNTRASTPFNGLNADLLKGLLFNMAGTPSRTDLWSLKISNSVQTRVWDWSRCTNVIITAGASGGPMVVQAGFFSRWGESEKPANSTVLPDGETAPNDCTWTAWNTAIVAGTLADVIDYDFRSDSGLGTTNVNSVWTAQQVRGFVLHLMRGQGPVDYLDGTRYCKEVASGKMSGALQLDINPASNTIPGLTATLRIHTNLNSASNSIKIALDLSRDSRDQPEDVGISTGTYNYTLYDATGGSPAEVGTF